MKIILITMGIATILPIVLHRTRYRRITRIAAGTTWTFFIAPSVLVVGTMGIHALMVTLGPPCFMPTSYHIGYMSGLIQDEEMGWGDEVEKVFKHLKQCKSDKQHLANQLLSDSDGTIAALGMDVVVEESLENGDSLLKQHYGDMRWNYYLASNDEYAKFMFVLWKMKQGFSLSITEKEIIEGWSDEYFEKVGVTPIAKAA